MRLAYFNTMGGTRVHGNPELGFSLGKRYARVFTQEREGHRSVYCFVDIATGDILKAAGWAAPAPGRRGSVFELDKMPFDATGGCFYRR